MQASLVICQILGSDILTGITMIDDISLINFYLRLFIAKTKTDVQMSVEKRHAF